MKVLQADGAASRRRCRRRRRLWVARRAVGRGGADLQPGGQERRRDAQRPAAAQFNKHINA